ncbi:MAG TPA: DUF3352 domain-containing protein [Chroococcidiopsis sp.]
MKFRSFVSALVVVVTVLALAGAGGFYWLVSNSPLGVLRGGQAEVEAAMFVPNQAPLMVSLLVNPDRLEAFRMATVPLDRRKAARAEIAQIRQTLLSGTGLDYAQDIQPWLGDEITWAVTTPDVDRDRTNGLQPGYLLAIATNNARRSREFLQLFWQQRAVAGTDLVFEQYAGVKLIYGRNGRSPDAAAALDGDDAAFTSDPAPDLTPALTSAVVGDRFVLLANYPKVLRDAINNVQAVDLNLSHSDAYQRAMQSLSSQQAGLVYSNLPELEHWLAGETPDGATTQTPLYSGLVLALNLDRQGLVGDTALLSAPGQSLLPAKPELAGPPEAAQFIPADSPLLAASRDLDALWQNVQAGLAGYDQPTALLSQVLGNLQRSPLALAAIATPATGEGAPGSSPERSSPPLPASPVNWVTDDYAFGLLPRSDQPQPDWVFVAKQTPATQEAIAQLDASVQAQGMSTGQIAIDDHDVTVWTTLSLNSSSSRRNKRQPATLQAEVKGVRTTVGRYEVLATSLDAIDRALHAPDRSLVATDDFKAAIAPLGDRNDGYLYLDWPTVRTVLRQKLPAFRLIETLGQPLLKHVRSLTLTSYGSDSTLRRGALFVRLKES